MADITIGTRGSALALVQTHWVAGELRAAHSGLDVAIRTYVTQGDRSQAVNTPLASYSEKGIFVKELESALLTGEIDAAVHSMKDLAAVLPDGLRIAATPLREDVRDVVAGSPLIDLPPGARVGTGSVRRRALLNYVHPDLTVLDIRGNVDTRIRKLREGQYDAIVLAAAGLNRLGRSAEIAEYLDPAVSKRDRRIYTLCRSSVRLTILKPKQPPGLSGRFWPHWEADARPRSAPGRPSTPA
jgi:hydroxymethylbilane synthase